MGDEEQHVTNREERRKEEIGAKQDSTFECEILRFQVSRLEIEVNQISKREEGLIKEKEYYKTEKEDLKKEKNEELARLRKEKDDEVARLRKEKDDEVARLRKEKDDEVARLRKEKDDEVARLEKEVERLRKEKDNEVERLRKEKDDEVARLRKEKDDEVARLEKEKAVLAEFSDKLSDLDMKVAQASLARRPGVRTESSYSRMFQEAKKAGRLQVLQPSWPPVELECGAEVGVVAEKRTEAEAQDFIQKVLQNVPDFETQFRSVPLCDREKAPSFGSRKPDIPCYLPNRDGPLAITTMIEVKRPRGMGSFSPEEQGRVWDFACDLLEKEQPHRAFIVVTLTDGYLFQFFKIIRVRSTGFIYEHSMVYTGKDGWNMLFGLLSQDPREIGFWLPDMSVFDNNPEFTINRALGVGAFTIAFKGEPTGNQKRVVVVKLDKEPHGTNSSSPCHREHAILTRLESKEIGFVPRAKKVGNTTDGYGYLVVEPIGKPLWPQTEDGERATGKHIKQLMLLLRDVHKAGVVHRDIKPANMYLDPSNNLLLNDWSSADRLNELNCELIVGTPEYHSPYPLIDEQDARIRDVIGALRSAYELLFGAPPPLLGEEGGNNEGEWNKRFAAAWWAEAVEWLTTGTCPELYERLAAKFEALKVV